MTIRIAISDDHALVRGGLVAIVALEPDMSVVGEAADGAGAVELHRRLRPDVHLMDLRMPVMDGLEATAAIRREFPQARVLALSLHRRPEEIAEARAAGASGYLDKHAARAQLASAIRIVHAGLPCFATVVR